MLKEKYGDKFIFWGGGVDTQYTLPYGTEDEIREEVTHNISILGKDGGFVFGTCHNIVANVPPENVITAFETALGHKICR
jgi:uroporphyrinogen-III decarboxylase